MEGGRCLRARRRRQRAKASSSQAKRPSRSVANGFVLDNQLCFYRFYLSLGVSQAILQCMERTRTAKTRGRLAKDHQSKKRHTHKHTPLGLLGERLTRSGRVNLHIIVTMACRGEERSQVSSSACQLVASQRLKTAPCPTNKQTLPRLSSGTPV